MRATFMPCSASGIAQPMITSSMRLDVDARRLRDHAAQHVREHVVGAGVAEHAACGALPTGVRVAATM